MKKSRGGLSRRDFLNTSLAGATTLASAPWMAGAPGDRARVRGTCMHDCPDTCAWIVTTENGKAVALEGDPNHPMTRGTLCETAFSPTSSTTLSAFCTP